MDIRKLVNNQRPQQPAPDSWQGAPTQTLPPFSAIFHDPSYANAYNYPMPPQGEGFNAYASYPYQQQQQQQPMFATVPAPQYTARPQGMPYLAPSSSNPSPRPSTTATKYPPSLAPQTSAERRSLSDEEDDGSDSDRESSGASSGGSTTPLPPYHFHPSPPAQQAAPAQAQQQVSFDQQQQSAAENVDYVCDDCGVSYSRAPDLRRHKASVHNDKDSREKVAATFPCEVCGQVLLSSHGYQGHMRRHYDERPFVCEAPFCGKAFHDSATLARHRRTHSTEHKFECDFCGRRFKRKDNLNTHRKKHQVGGETINPNLLRKPVTRVAGQSDSPPPQQQPQQAAVPSYADLALSSPATSTAPTSYAPPYSILNEEPPRHSFAPAPQPQPYYAAPPPSYYQPPQQYAPYHQQPRMVKAEEDFTIATEYRSRAIRGVHIAPASGR